MVGEEVQRIRVEPAREAEQRGQVEQPTDSRQILCGRILRMMGDGMECSRCGECLKVIGDEMDLIYSLAKLLAEYESAQQIPQPVT